MTDVDDGTGPDEDLPEVSKAGAIDVARDASGKPMADVDPEAKEAQYSRTGWAPQFGTLGGEGVELESLLDHSTWVEGRLPDKLYGGKLPPRYQYKEV